MYGKNYKNSDTTTMLLRDYHFFTNRNEFYRTIMTFEQTNIKQVCYVLKKIKP